MVLNRTFLKMSGTTTNANVCAMFDLSAAAANRILAKMTDERKIQKIRIGQVEGI